MALVLLFFHGLPLVIRLHLIVLVVHDLLERFELGGPSLGTAWLRPPSDPAMAPPAAIVQWFNI